MVFNVDTVHLVPGGSWKTQSLMEKTRILRLLPQIPLDLMENTRILWIFPPNIWGAWSEDLQRDSVLTDLVSVPVPLPNARAFPPACHCSMAKAMLALVFLIDPLTISRGLHVTVGISSWGGTSILLRKLRGNPTHWRVLQQGESFESCHLGSGSVKWLSSEPREVSGQRVLRALSKITGSSSEATTRVWWSNRKRGIWGPGVACWLHLPPDVLGDSIKPRAPP